MSNVGFQNFWVSGARFYYKRDDADDGTKFPWIDLGVVKKATPNVTTEKVSLMDSDGGRKKLVDEAMTSIDESYDIQGNNLNPDNLALIFLANPPSEFTQAVTEYEVSHHVHPGKLLKLVDSDDVPMYKLGKVIGLMVRDAGADLTEVEITAMDVSDKTITVTGNIASEFDAGDKIVVRTLDLANPLNAGTYTVVSAAGVGPAVITVEEAPVADEVAISGLLIYKADAGDAGTIYGPDVDFEDVSLDRGFIRIIATGDGGAIAAEDEIVVIFQTAALSGQRLINPHDLQDNVKGKAILVFSREDNGEQSAREFYCSMTPNGFNPNDSDFSDFTITVKIISQPTEAVPAGRLLQFVGDLPDES